MGNFVGGFLLASVFWGLGFWAYTEGHFERFANLSGSDVLEVDTPQPSAEDDEPEEKARSRRKRRRSGKRAQRQTGGDPNRTMRVGDSLGGREQIDMSEGGGEAQLSAAQVDATFDKLMSSIRRCFFLADSNAPTTGILRFGLRIESNGKVSRSNLTGPSGVVQGESGVCLRKVADNARFPSFDGPAMQVKYPVRLE